MNPCETEWKENGLETLFSSFESFENYVKLRNKNMNTRRFMDRNEDPDRETSCCVGCGTDMPKWKPRYCCSGTDCDCRGAIQNIPLCSRCRL